MEHVSLFSTTLNTALGVGFLGIPYAFQNSGMLYSLIALLLCSFMTYYVGTLAIEVMLSESEEIKEPLQGGKIKFFIELVNPPYSHGLIILFAIMLLGFIISYSSVFATSLAENIPLPGLNACDIYVDGGDCIVNYRIYLTLFILVTYILIILGIKEQQSFQIALAILRFLLIITLVLEALHHILTTTEDLSEFSYINLDNFEICYTSLIFALVYQHGLPSISEISREKVIFVPKRVSLAMFFSYGILGITIGMAYPNIERMCTLNYKYLDGFFGNALKSFVILCPAFDVIASGAVCGISLTENLLIHFGLKSLWEKIVLKTGLVLIAYSVSLFFYNLVFFI